ncbi:MAG: 16S rRNA (adenine(1518)-N(6)/adenine(1519)-N(6))-dimethyltransferase RsmA [bacterium]
MTPTLAQVTKELLATYIRYPRKSLGQHFLIDPQVLARIIAAAELTKDDLVLEIGSGLGIVTSEIAPLVYQMIAVEIDKELVSMSKEVLKPFDNISFVDQDILKVELKELILGRKYKVIGNLPYYITSPIIAKLLEAEQKPEIIVIMIQKEVAERMIAPPGSKTYGSFSIFVQYYAEVQINSLVSKSSFLPWPEVGSAVVVLKPHQAPKYKVNDEKLLFELVHKSFQQRRKQIRNSLKEYNLENAGINMSRRPETLSIEEFASLANYFNSAN